MVVIRLARGGAKKKPFYRIMVADRRRATTGRSLEQIGIFNPDANEGEERLRIDTARADHWATQGAQVSPRVAKLLKEQRAQ